MWTVGTSTEAFSNVWKCHGFCVGITYGSQTPCPLQKLNCAHPVLVMVIEKGGPELAPSCRVISMLFWLEDPSVEKYLTKKDMLTSIR
jgi:hypothetical protein